MSKRPATTFFEFEYKKDKKKIEELGLTYTKQKAGEVKKTPIEDKERKRIPYVLCPICCRNQPLNRTGVYRRNIKKVKGKKDYKKPKEGNVELRSIKYNPDKETSFGKFDFANSPFISIREATGSEGILEVEIITIKQVKNMSAGDKAKIIPIINAIRDSCLKTLELTDGLI